MKTSIKLYRTISYFLFSSILLTASCSSDSQTLEDQVLDGLEESNDSGQDEQVSETGEQENECPESIGFMFNEANGVISIEFEDNNFSDGWELKNDGMDVSGDGYMQWEGNPNMGNPGNGKVTFPVNITTTGTYRFVWKSSFRAGDNGTEHNDSWLRFPNADDFFGRKNDGSVVYPNGSGKEPNPNGSSSDGWFKVYRSGNDNAFKWQASTSDHDAHDIFATFLDAGVYFIEISARSDFHGIDRLLMFQEEMSLNEALDLADNFSTKTTCN